MNCCICLTSSTGYTKCKIELSTEQEKILVEETLNKKGMKNQMNP